MFRCAGCNEVMSAGYPAMTYHFKNEEEKEKFENRMKPILKFGRNGKTISKRNNSQKGKWAVELCSSCWEEMK